MSLFDEALEECVLIDKTTTNVNDGYGGVQTSNNIGIIDTEVQGSRVQEAQCLISSHTRSFSSQAMDELADNILRVVREVVKSQELRVKS